MHGVNPYPVSVIGILPLPESGGKDTKMTDMMNCVDKLLEKKISGYKQRMAVNPCGDYRWPSKFSIFHVLSKICGLHMSFNNGNERRKLNTKWEHLRVQYRKAGMSEDAIQAMYEFDLGVLNSERAYITNTMTVSDTIDDSTATETSDFKQYEKAITVTDTYHETKSRFTWIGEIENEQLLTALETLKTEDLEIITMYAYEGYDITEISKVYGVSRPIISIKIKRIAKFLKNFNFNATN